MNKILLWFFSEIYYFGYQIKEEDEYGEGIESLITRVENLLVNGKLAQAADELEIGLRGSQAEEAVAQWVRQVRARAIAEQTLSLLQSYASSITFS
jgi:MICOS complex subunit MIC60